MSEKDTISAQLLREALLQSCAPGAATAEVLHKLGIDPRLLDSTEARLPATTYAKCWRLLARRGDDEFFGMDPRKLKSGSFAFLCRTAMLQPNVAAGLTCGLDFLSLMLERLPAQLVRQQSLAEIVLLEDDKDPRRAFTYFTYWMIVHGVACWLAGRRIPILAIELRCSETGFLRRLSGDVFREPAIRPAAHADDFLRRLPGLADQAQPRRAQAVPGPCAGEHSGEIPRPAEPRQSHQERPAPPAGRTLAGNRNSLAQRLCMSASTLRRRLAEEGQTYQGLKDSVRKELAIVWLAEPAISFSEIATRLGFADVSSFYKAFRKWSGSNPGHYRSLILNDVE